MTRTDTGERSPGNHLKSIYRELQLRGQHELYDFWRRLDDRSAW